MTFTRRNVLSGLATTLSALAPFPALALPTLRLPLAPAPASQSLNGYSFFDIYRRVWPGEIELADYLPFLRSHRWHFDGATYDQPIICCVTNGRVFTVHRHQDLGTAVREIWIKGLTDYTARGAFSGALAGAACHAAAWACKFPRGMPTGRWGNVYLEGHSGAVYIDFPAADFAVPVVTDAPPLLIHERLTRRCADANDELRGLAQILDDWMTDLPGIPAVVLFGSRVRGDHRPDSDVNLAVFLEEWGDRDADDEEAKEWWAQQTEEDFATINALLPGPLSVHLDTLADPSLRMYEARGNPVLEVGKVFCTFTPPKPSPRQAVQIS